MNKILVEVSSADAKPLKALEKQIKGGSWLIAMKDLWLIKSFRFLPPNETTFGGWPIPQGSLVYHTKEALFVARPVKRLDAAYLIEVVVHPVTYSPDDNFGEELEGMPFKSLLELKSFPEIIFFPDILTQNMNGIEIPYADYSSPVPEYKKSEIKKGKDNVKNRYKEEMLKATLEFGKRNPDIPKRNLVYEMMSDLDLPEEELWFEAVVQPNPDFRAVIQASKPIVLRWV